MQAGNLLGSLLGGVGGNAGQGAFASLAGQLAVAQAAVGGGYPSAPPAPRFDDTPRLRVSGRSVGLRMR